MNIRLSCLRGLLQRPRSLEIQGRVLGLFVLCLLLLSSLALSSQLKASRVVDGNTIKVRDASGEKTIRLVGIDAPEVSHKKREPGQPFSQQATQHLAGLVLNKNVDIQELGHDRYGRILGVVSLGGKKSILKCLRQDLRKSTAVIPLPVKISPPTGRPRKKPRLQNEACGCKVISIPAQVSGGNASVRRV
jgi:hypothetical protein